VIGMPMTKEAWAEIPPEERRRRALKGRRTSAVKIITRDYAELSEDDKDALYDTLFPEGGRR
jgi:3-methyladenine DNA glycosylase/8-oxoguanine DNA glycosylase